MLKPIYGGAIVIHKHHRLNGEIPEENEEVVQSNIISFFGNNLWGIDFKNNVL